ncbi:sensor histidine kinase [Ahniella affigens]|uniref:Sensor histidine kinase n=1 Tax=Ahniella affigens TaxID=2021234 RepID=A0A2P1PRA4_9GAMM|nr:sensor histidine kinase [Ahniella affigens]AVP97380.1 sensor histidine kinase [Ahniella affigens]
MAHPWHSLEKQIRQRLLPPVNEPGAMPFFSLNYLLMLFLPLVMPRGNAQVNWWFTGIAVALFLPLYFRFYWERGARRLVVLALINMIGLALMPANLMAGVFLIYSWVLVAHMSWSAMASFIAATSAVSWLTYQLVGMPTTVWGFGIVFPGLMAAIGCKIWYNNARRNEALRLSQEELANMARVAERERIGRDLHDLLGHTLSVITLKSELASRLAERDPAAAATEMREVERISRKALMEVRRAVSGMRAPGMLAELANIKVALSAALVDFEYEAEPVVLDQDIEGVLGFVVREAATNVIRHANARRCRLLMKKAGDLVRLEIEDDGRGGVTESGNGLRGLRERLSAVGGTLELDSPLGGGTRLVVHVPIDGSGDESAGRRVALKLVSSR